ncbi:hypothetical protein MAPG_01747 [Magnaporthiopsis poae ATCC 64411]|uniref:Uncharacterized protein n=1 Tax=Magnaporthiopsis poae (strain ATCC 64411 / 73-15) TaxID=644358 RepID=A0A0C4DPI0_MAGP6|nr:hypothetical protein MAPG_01747 [Magnaporthiopsis poae ATCC 64411]
MSSQAQSGPSAPQEKEKRGLGKVLSRMKTVLKRDRRKSTMTSTSVVVTAGPSTAPTKPTVSEPIPPPRPKVIELPGTVKIPRAQIYEERARRLGEKYGLEIKPSEWHSTEGHALRVDKPIRMRVRRECHVCTAQFGSTKECPKCQHPRCEQCVRYPPHRTEEELVASRIHRAAILKEQKENAPIIPDYSDPLREKKIVLKKPAKTGGQDLVHKKARQRVRRTCHECQTLFKGSNKACSNCSHVRCTDCPRDPPKKDKYPYGYPGDEFGPNSIPHYQCHSCKNKFPPAADPGTECSKCSHKKCDQCPRLLPQKVEPEPDPATLQSMEIKLASLRL